MSTPDRIKENPYNTASAGAKRLTTAVVTPPPLLALSPPLHPPSPAPPSHVSAPCVRSTGTDFVRNHRPSSIDFTTIHAWVDQWLSCNDECRNNWFRQWIRGHIQESNALGKPLLLEEFGRPRPVNLRNQLYRRARCWRLCCASDALVATVFFRPCPPDRAASPPPLSRPHCCPGAVLCCRSSREQHQQAEAGPSA